MPSLERLRTDRLELEFYSTEDILEHGQERLDFFVDALEDHMGELMPTKAHLGAPDVRRWRRVRNYSRALVHQMVKEERSVNSLSVWLFLVKPSSPEVEFTASISNNPDVKSRFRLLMKVIPFGFFTEPLRLEERSRKLIALVRALAIQFPPLYAIAHSVSDHWLAEDPNNDVDATFEQLHEVYWINVLGKQLIDSLGRERVLSTPAYLVEALPGGSVLLVPHPTPAFASEEARHHQARALVHLRPDLSFDTVLARLRERSAALVPVTPAFEPDLAPLLTRTLDKVPVWERQREIARLNAYRPPDVSQWMPVQQAPASDVADLDEAGILYEVLHLQRLTLLFQKQVPSVKTRTPESLVDLDFHLWEMHYQDFKDERLKLAVYLGSYLGTVMAHHLQGRWVFCKKIAKSHVVVGERAWFPVRRAFAALQNRQAIIDQSLSGFYRAAERHLLAFRAPRPR